MTGEQESYKRAAAIHAVAEVSHGMIVGLGSGTTAALAVEALAVRVRAGLRVAGIPTSEATAALARQLGVPLTRFSEHARIDMTIDGADQVERGTLNLIKGLGGALFREKIVAAASTRMVVIVDASKLVDRLGAATSLPVEISSFGWESVLDRLTAMDLAPRLRARGPDDGKGVKDRAPFITDGGNYIADCRVEQIADPAELERRLNAVVGVIASGLFIGLATRVVVGGLAGITILDRRSSKDR